MRKGFPLAIILKNDRKKYYAALQRADGGDFKSLVLFTAQAVERTLDLYLRTFTQEKSGSLLTLANVSTHTVRPEIYQLACPYRANLRTETWEDMAYNEGSH